MHMELELYPPFNLLIKFQPLMLLISYQRKLTRPFNFRKMDMEEIFRFCALSESRNIEASHLTYR